MLSVILPYEARTFLTVRPFGIVPRDRVFRSLFYYTPQTHVCQVKLRHISKKEKRVAKKFFLCYNTVKEPIEKSTAILTLKGKKYERHV